MNVLLEEASHDEGTEASPRTPSGGTGHAFSLGGESSAIPEDEVLDLDENPGAAAPPAASAGASGGSGGGGGGMLGGGGSSGSSWSAALSNALPAPFRMGLRSSSLGGQTGSTSSSSSGPGGPTSGSHVAAKANSKYSPLPWSDYFQESFDVTLPNGDVFHLYKAGSGGAVALCLHGGGYSGLSFAVAAQQMRQQQQRSGVPSLTILALDLRGHGLTRTQNDLDLSSETLSDDVVRVVRHLYPSDPPPLVLLGHSMGGAVAIRAAAAGQLQSLSGLVVVDVVEGTALASLVHMQAILAARPTRFPSLEKAVEWTLRNGHVRNVESARVSVPSTLVFDEAQKQFVWRAALEKSEGFWRGWYTGLSEVFLASHVPKILLLAGTDRLDKPLTIAQMQGKFQMLVVRHSGHAIQEDEPGEFASSVLHFIARNRISDHGTLFARWGGAIHP